MTKCKQVLKFSTSQTEAAEGPNIGREGGGHCVFKQILRGHFKPTPNATV